MARCVLLLASGAHAVRSEPMALPATLIPIHQCYYFGDDAVDPVKVFTQYLIRNPQYARQRDPACEVHLYIVDRPTADRLSCPASYLKKTTTTIGAIRAAAAAITGEDFNRPAPTEAQIAGRKAKKAAKKAKKAEHSQPVDTAQPPAEA